MLLHTFKMFWPIFKNFFLPNFFVNFSNVGCDFKPSRTTMKQQIIFLQVYLWAIRNYANS